MAKMVYVDDNGKTKFTENAINFDVCNTSLGYGTTFDGSMNCIVACTSASSFLGCDLSYTLPECASVTLTFTGVNLGNKCWVVAYGSCNCLAPYTFNTAEVRTVNFNLAQCTNNFTLKTSDGLVPSCIPNITVEFEGRNINNTAVGNSSLGTLIGVNNVGVGHCSTNCVIGDDNIGIGVQSGKNVIGFRNIGIGNNSLVDITGDDNIGIGNCALSSMSYESCQNLAIGNYSLSSVVCTTGNIGIGHNSLKSYIGSDSVAIGLNAGFQSTTANDNVIVGSNAFCASSSGSATVSIGYSSMLNSTDTTGRNVVIGACALSECTTGSYSVAIGFETMKCNCVARSVAIGAYASGTADTVSIGYNSLCTLTTGICNVSIGYNAGNVITTGSNDIIIGANAGTGLASDTSNTIYIGNNSITATYITGIYSNYICTTTAGIGMVVVGSDNILKRSCVQYIACNGCNDATKINCVYEALKALNLICTN